VDALGVQHAPCATGFTPILLITAAIGPILDDIAAAAAPTVLRDGFLDHPFILLITYY
jgi:hypothetical protein